MNSWDLGLQDWMSAMESLGRNLRFAVRLFLKSPGFSIAAIATLALGVGANTAIFSVVKAVMVAPLPYANPGDVVMIWDATAPEDTTHLSLQEVVSYGEGAASFASVGGYIESAANLTGGDDPERVRAAVVTGDLFSTLGVSPIMGRWLAGPDGAPGAAEVVVLGHALWQRRFGGAADIVGRTIPVNGRLRTVVGIMPPTFRLPLDYLSDRPTELWIAEVVNRANLGQWGDRSHTTVARLAAGASRQRPPAR